MKKIYQSVRGMHDFLPPDTYFLAEIEYKIKKILSSYAYSEIRMPILENTKLFNTSIGNNTDILKKEMYSFYDRSNNNISLRPEGTISCIRACIQSNIFKKSKIQKLWYYGPMFRYERPQKGRYRQFSQFGVEIFGLSDPIIDLEIILLIINIWKSLKIYKNLKLEINSIGSIQDRVKYSYDLIQFFKKNTGLLQNDLKKLLNYKNPMKVLDTKNEILQEFLKKGPKLLNYLNKKSYERFKKLCFFLDQNNILYTINYNLVRGLDYYNDTVFEWKSIDLGSKNTICAGGRYDLLTQNISGMQNFAIGFAIGIERLLILKKIKDNFDCKKNIIDVNILFQNSIFSLFSIYIAEKLRLLWPKLRININFSEISIKKKIKQSIHMNVRHILLLDEKTLHHNYIVIKNIVNTKEKKYHFNRIFQKPCVFN